MYWDILYEYRDMCALIHTFVGMLWHWWVYGDNDGYLLIWVDRCLMSLSSIIWILGFGLRSLSLCAWANRSIYEFIIDKNGLIINYMGDNFGFMNILLCMWACHWVYGFIFLRMYESTSDFWIYYRLYGSSGCGFFFLGIWLYRLSYEFLAWGMRFFMDNMISLD